MISIKADEKDVINGLCGECIFSAAKCAEDDIQECPYFAKEPGVSGGGEIMACPFCGGEGKIECNDDPRLYNYYVHCVSCGSHGGWAKGKEGAILHWNMRAK